SHYTLVSSVDPGFPGPGAFVVNSNVFPIGPWLTNGPNSKWIAPQANEGLGNLSGDYTYRTTFNLTGFNAATAVITGRAAADNSVTIKLNGVTIGSATSFTAFTSFSASSGFLAGVNTLDFVVNNAVYSSANPTGLRVDVSGTVSP
ncbi:MAG: PEP-CTERM sorting domain-containing protein, partial [Bryobacteraceae bacterium]